MTDADQGNRDDKRQRWQMIASLLGVPVPEEPELPIAEEPATGDSSPDEQDIGSSSPVGPPRAPKPKAPRSDRRPGDWHALCAQLGVDAPPPPLPPPPLPPPPAPSAPTPSAKAGWVSVDDERSVASEDDSGTEMQSVGDTSPPDQFSGRDPARTFFDPDAAQEVDTVDDACDESESDESADSIDDEQSAGGSASRSASESPDRRRRKRRKRRIGPRPRADEPADGNAVIDDDDAVIEPDSEGTVDKDTVSEGVDESRRRGDHPSRRTQRRERLSDDESVEESGAPDFLYDDEVELAADDDSDYGDPSPLARDEDDDADHDDDDDGDDARGEGESRARHKKIPTWEETIGVIVANNMDSRRREGNGKGRPRGGRRRGRDGHDRQ